MIKFNERQKKSINTFIGIIQFFFYGQVIRTPLTLLASSIQPLSFIFIITLVGGIELLPSVIVGAVVYFATSYGLTDLPIEFSGLEKRSKFKQIFVASPISPLTFIIGSSIGINLAAFPQLIILITAFILLTNINLVYFPVLFLVIFLLWIWGSATGFYISTKIHDPMPLIRYSNLLLMATTVLLPVYYPSEIIPRPYRELTLLFPTSGSAYILRSLPNNSLHTIESVVALIFLSLVSLLFLVVAVKKSEWREG